VKEKELKAEDVEYAAIKSAENFGMPEKMWIEDTETGEMVFVNMKNPSEKAIEMLWRVYNHMKEKPDGTVE
jgi:hypothetical protein